jgi:hypothetical protein
LTSKCSRCRVRRLVERWSSVPADIIPSLSLSSLPSLPLLPRRLHNQYIYPVSINKEGRYNVPQDPKGGYSITFKPEAIEHYSFPGKPGSYWEAAAKGEQKAWNDKHGKAVRD